MGNIFGKRAGKGKGLSPVMSGSHIDSQPKGGRFDGILGVMGVLEVVRTLNDHGIETERPITIVDWTNEEGTRFSPAMAGSGVWTAKLDRDWVYGRADIHGKTFGQELERIGYKGKLRAKQWPVHAYYEYHIEQGPVLEREGCLHWYDIYVEGTANQVGPTPMEGRSDALCAAAEMILKVNELPAKVGGNMVATVGEIHNFPNSRNIIPDRVHFTVDIRSWDDELVTRAWEDLKLDFGTIAARRECPLCIEETWRVGHTPFEERLVKRVLGIAGQLGYSHEPGCTNCNGIRSEYRRPEPRGGGKYQMGGL